MPCTNVGFQVLSGRNCAWAKAAANGEANKELLPAVEHDLDILQKLAVGEKTLTAWIREAHPDIPEAWLAAGQLLLFPSSRKWQHRELHEDWRSVHGKQSDRYIERFCWEMLV